MNVYCPIAPSYRLHDRTPLFLTVCRLAGRNRVRVSVLRGPYVHAVRKNRTKALYMYMYM